MKYFIFLLILITSCGKNHSSLENTIASLTLLTGWELDTSKEVVTLTSPGIQNSQYFSSGIAYGDFNGDGEPDLAVSQYLGDTNTIGIYNFTDTGAVYIYYSINKTSLRGDADLVITKHNSNQSQFGRSLGSGDINNDGITDLIVGTPNEDLTPPNTNSGSVYIYYGTNSGLPETHDQVLSQPTNTINSGFGYGIFVKDLDGDGNKEIIIGSMLDDTIAANAGAAWIFTGQDNYIYITNAAVKLTLTGGTATDYCGQGIWVHDYNNDGIDDIYMGCPREDTAGTDRGAVLIYHGTGVQGVWVTNNSVPDATLVNPISSNSDYYGSSISVMDYDGDGKDDLIVGAYNADDSFTDSGAIYLYSDIQNDTTVDAVKGPPYNSGFGAEYFGHTMTVGDTNNDGLTDLIIGLPLAYHRGYRHGKVGIHLGTTSGGVNFSEFGQTIFYDYHKLPSQKRTAESDEFGSALCEVDFNKDGIKDLAVGARLDDTKFTDDGQVYIYYGRPNGVILNNPDVKINSGGIYNSARTFGTACLEMDINKDGNTDLLIGAEGDDNAAGAAGAVYIFYGTSTEISTTLGGIFYGPSIVNYGFGKSLAKGDLDNDGFDDLIVGAQNSDSAGTNRGSVYIFRSNSTTGFIDLTTLGATQIFGHGGSVNTDNLGASVLAYDYDGDGDLDLLAGAPGDDDIAAASGRVYIWRNGTTGATAGANTLIANGAHTTTIDEPNATLNHAFGSALSKSLYLNTSYPDLFIGAELDDTNGINAGAIHIYEGTASGFDTTALSLRGLDPNPSTDLNENLGSAISIFDFNNDGKKDLLMGAKLDDIPGTSSGSVYIKLQK